MFVVFDFFHIDQGNCTGPWTGIHVLRCFIWNNLIATKQNNPNRVHILSDIL